MTVRQQETEARPDAAAPHEPPWTSPGAEAYPMSLRQIAEDQALRMIEEVRSQIPAWQRTLRAAIAEATAKKPDRYLLARLLRLEGDGGTPEHDGPGAGRHGPRQAVARFAARDAMDPRLPVEAVLGHHVEHVIVGLSEAADWWEWAADHATADWRIVASSATQASAALSSALQHALYLTFLDDARDAHPGQRSDVADCCEGWGLDDAQIAEVWLWVSHDGLRFGEHRLPLALDTENRCVYRKPARRWTMLWTTTAPLWGGALAFALVTLTFALLDAAGLQRWPAEWGWKMGVLFAFVVIGALLHLGSRVMNISYDSPIGVYDAGGLRDWLALRWLGVLQMYVPVVFVVGSLWGAGNVPGSFQELGTAVLAGYSADSLFRAAVGRLGGERGQDAAPRAPRAARPGPVSTP